MHLVCSWSRGWFLLMLPFQLQRHCIWFWYLPFKDHLQHLKLSSSVMLFNLFDRLKLLWTQTLLKYYLSLFFKFPEHFSLQISRLWEGVTRFYLLLLMNFLMFVYMLARFSYKYIFLVRCQYLSIYESCRCRRLQFRLRSLPILCFQNTRIIWLLSISIGSRSRDLVVVVVKSLYCSKGPKYIERLRRSPQGASFYLFLRFCEGVVRLVNVGWWIKISKRSEPPIPLKHKIIYLLIIVVFILCSNKFSCWESQNDESKQQFSFEIQN